MLEADRAEDGPVPESLSNNPARIQGPFEIQIDLLDIHEKKEAPRPEYTDRMVCSAKRLGDFSGGWGGLPSDDDGQVHVDWNLLVVDAGRAIVQLADSRNNLRIPDRVEALGYLNLLRQALFVHYK